MAATSVIRSFGFGSMSDSKTDRKSRVHSNQPSAHCRELSRRHSVIRDPCHCAKPCLCRANDEAGLEN